MAAVAAARGTSSGATPVKNGGTLTIGLAEEPDALDPTLARTFVGRIVFLAMCEKLYDLDSHLNIVPQLATALPQVSAGQADLHDQAAEGRPVQRRHAVQRRRRQDVARPRPDPQGLGACERDLADHEDRHSERNDRRAASVRAVLAADRAARRPRGDDHVAEGARLRAVRSRRSRLRRPLHVQGPRRRRPHHVREVAVLLRQGEGAPRVARLQDHDRPELAHPGASGRRHPGRGSRPVDRRARRCRATRASPSARRSRSATRG